MYLLVIGIIIAIIVGIIKSVADNKEKEKLELEKKRTELVVALQNRQFEELSTAALEVLGLSSWNVVPYIDTVVTVKSRQALENFDEIKFFKEDSERLEQAGNTLQYKKDIATDIEDFLKNNEFKSRPQYYRLANQLSDSLRNAAAYRIKVNYVTSAGNNLDSKELSVTQRDIYKFKKDPTLLMSKTEYNQYLKVQQKEALNKKHHEYYESVSQIIDYANDNKDLLVIKNSKEQLDSLIGKLFEKTINSIKKIKTIDSEEWDIIGGVIAQIKKEVEEIVGANKRILPSHFI